MKINRIEREKRTVALMIRMYCRHKEGNRNLCPECRRLMDYAWARLDHCPEGINKPACRKCPTHCYSPSKQAAIRQVMRYSGPRMMFYWPLEWLRHMLR